MSKEISPERKKRLGCLIRILGNGGMRKGEVLRALNYTGIGAFEKDLSCLRREYGAEIDYDKKKKTYSIKAPALCEEKLRQDKAEEKDIP